MKQSPFCLQLRQMFTNLKNSFTSRVTDKSVVKSQGSVATCLRRGRIFKQEFVANWLLSPLVKNFENRIIVGEVMTKSLVSCCFDSWCRVVENSRANAMSNMFTSHARAFPPSLPRGRGWEAPGSARASPRARARSVGPTVLTYTYIC